MRMTPEQYRAFLARHGDRQETPKSATQDEADLHSCVVAECQRRGWIAFHGSMAHRTYRTPGEPDFVILADGGSTILVECKTRVGKLSTDQLGIQAWAKKLDHTIHVVRSMEDFLKVIQPATQNDRGEG
jgi:hypothetical protein